MSFWSRPTLQPARQHRFRIVFTKTRERLESESRRKLDSDLASGDVVIADFGSDTNRDSVQIQKDLLIQQAANAVPPSDYWWWAKSCTLPSFEVGQFEYQLVNFKFKYPGMLVWNDVTITLVEVGDKAKEILSILSDAGYACPGSNCGSGIEKSGFSRQGQLKIQQINSTGNPDRTWDLRNWFIKGVRFGEQNYESDDIVSIEMTVGYDCAILE